MKTLNGTRTEAPKMYETENDISKERRTELNALMNQRLASAVDLQSANEASALECERPELHRPARTF
jgi:hypothetical protein